MICFLGSSHAAVHLREAAIARGNSVCTKPENAQVIFISEDTPTNDEGVRNLHPIKQLIHSVKDSNAQLVLTSQVPPGFTRSLNINNIYHQAETLRISDAVYRALHPEYIAVGGPQGICREYADYLISFHCPVLRMSWEDAEFSKIAVNMMLAAQVDYANRMSAFALSFGADWKNVCKALYHDKRIGFEAYLTPGRWQDSKHLLRDYKTLQEKERKEIHWQDAIE